MLKPRGFPQDASSAAAHETRTRRLNLIRKIDAQYLFPWYWSANIGALDIWHWCKTPPLGTFGRFRKSWELGPRCDTCLGGANVKTCFGTVGLYFWVILPFPVRFWRSHLFEPLHPRLCKTKVKAGHQIVWAFNNDKKRQNQRAKLRLNHDRTLKMCWTWDDQMVS